MPHRLEAGESAPLRLERIDGKGFEAAASGMGHVVAAAADRASIPGIVHVSLACLISIAMSPLSIFPSSGKRNSK